MPTFLKKKFSQNFLIDGNILKKIGNLIPSENLNILEIGPGDGKLTDKIILRNPKRLTLVEIDDDLIKELKKKYLKYKAIELIKSDILKFHLNKEYHLVISNLPYHISSQILIKLILLEKNPKVLILMFQREFAKKVLDKKLNSLNSIIKCFYSVKLDFNISKNCFRPVPKVDSTILTFKRLEKKLLKKNEIGEFILFKRKLFTQKRKSLKNILKKYNLDPSFNLNLRAENLELKELIRLFRSINV